MIVIPSRVAAVCNGVAILLMFSLGTLYSWSVFVPPLEAEFAQSRSAISAVFSVAIIFFAIGMLAAPSIVGARPAWAVAFLTCLLAAAGLTLAAQGNSVWMVIAGFGVLFGLANGFGYSLSLQAVDAPSSKRRGLFIGISVASYTAGSAAGTPVLAALLDVWGYRVTLLLLAAYFVAIGCVVCLLLRAVSRDVPASRRTPQERAVRAPARELVILWFCFLCSSLVGVMILAHAAPLVMSLKGSARDIVLAVVVASAGNGFGRLAGGWLSDCIPARALLGGASALIFLALALFAVVQNAEAALISLALVGMGYGCIASGLPAIIANTYGSDQMGRIYGRVFTAWGLAGALGPVIGGGFFDADGDYTRAIMMAGGMALAAAAFGAAYSPRAGYTTAVNRVTNGDV